MTTRELIQAEIEHLTEQELEELYRLLKGVRRPRHHTSRSLMSKLKGIRIDAPEDFAANFELYTSGEKGAQSDLR